ncbi:MAG: hypothetical protein QOI78_1396 [Actinomycetota bacterium]|nr:hypothetical protein [Actinomycetota bacterium]
MIREPGSFEGGGDVGGPGVVRPASRGGVVLGIAVGIAVVEPEPVVFGGVSARVGALADVVERAEDPRRTVFGAQVGEDVEQLGERGDLVEARDGVRVQPSPWA